MAIESAKLRLTQWNKVLNDETIEKNVKERVKGNIEVLLKRYPSLVKAKVPEVKEEVKKVFGKVGNK